VNGRWSQVSEGRSVRASTARGRASRLVVGIKLFHTPGDSERAVRAIDSEIHSLVDAVYAAMGVDRSSLYWGASDTILDSDLLREWRTLSSDEKDKIIARIDAAKIKAQQSPYWGFFQAVVSPVFADWITFRQSEQFYDLWTSWEEYEKWLERARQLRAAVRDKGIHVESPEPVDLTKTLGGEAIDKLTKATTDLWTLAKVAIYGALAIGGIVVVGSVTQSLRTGKDPAHQLAAIPKAYR
jgi:hypothetical protein